MKLSNSKIPKLLSSKHQSKKRKYNNIKHKRNANMKNSFRKKYITNLRQKSLKKRLKGGTISETDQKKLDSRNADLEKLEQEIVKLEEVETALEQHPLNDVVAKAKVKGIKNELKTTKAEYFRLQNLIEAKKKKI